MYILDDSLEEKIKIMLEQDTDFSEFGGEGSGFKGHKGRDATNERGGSLPRGAGNARDENGDTAEDRKRNEDYVARMKADYAKRNEIHVYDNYSELNDTENRAYWIRDDDKIMASNGYQAMGTPAHTLIMAKYITENPNEFSDKAVERAIEALRVGEQENYLIEAEGFDKGFIKVRDEQSGTIAVDVPNSLVGAPNVWDDKSIRENRAKKLIKKLYNKNLLPSSFEDITVYNGGTSIVNIERQEVLEFSIEGPTIFYLDGSIEVDLGGPGSGFFQHKGRDETNQVGGSVAEEEGHIEDPRWGKNAKFVDGVLVAQGKIGLAKDKWAVVKDDGEMGSNYHDTPEEAIEESNKFAADAADYGIFRDRRNAAFGKAKNKEALSKDEIAIIAGYSSGMVSEQSAIGIVREMGLRWTDARKVVSSSKVEKITSSGITLRKLTDVLESFYAWNENKELSGPTVVYLDGTKETKSVV